MKEQLQYSLIAETVLPHPSLPPFIYPFPQFFHSSFPHVFPSFFPSFLAEYYYSCEVDRSWMMLLVHGVLHCKVISSWVISYLSACTHTGLPMSVSPQPFCTPVGFALVANIFHVSEILLTSATSHLLESATYRRKKNKINIPEHRREEVLPWHSTKLSF